MTDVLQEMSTSGRKHADARKLADGQAEIAAAHERDAAAREQDRPMTADDFLRRTAAAVAWALPALTPDEQSDLASELRINVARKHGWTPRPSEVARTFLGKRAAALWSDSGRSRLSGQREPSLSAPVGEGDATGTDFLSSASGASDRLAVDVGWEDVADALALTDERERLAVMVALSAGVGGKGDPDALAVAADRMGVTVDSAAVILTRVRKRLAERWQDRDTMLALLADADAADAPLLPGPVPADGRPVPLPVVGPVYGLALPEALRASLHGVRNPTPVHPDARPRLSALQRAVSDALSAMVKPAERAPSASGLSGDGWGVERGTAWDARAPRTVALQHPHGATPARPVRAAAGRPATPYRTVTGPARTDAHRTPARTVDRTAVRTSSTPAWGTPTTGPLPGVGPCCYRPVPLPVR